MPRYFAHVRCASGFFLDRAGSDVDLTTPPHEVALKAAQKLSEDFRGLDIREWSIVMADEIGDHVLTLPVEQAARASVRLQ